MTKSTLDNKRIFAYKIRAAISNVIFRYDLLTGNYQKSTTILCYHSFSRSKFRYSVDPQTFERQILKLSKYAEFIKLDDIHASSLVKRKKSKIILTIDDGYQSVKNILPITRKYNIPVTLFVLSNPSKANRYELETRENLLTIDDINLLRDEGWQIGCHSATHPNLTTLNDTQLEEEIIHSKLELGGKLGCEITSFAYPKGQYDTNIMRYIKKAKFKYAYTINSDIVTNKSNPLLMPRTIIDATHQISELPGILSPTWIKLRKHTNKYRLWERYMS